MIQRLIARRKIEMLDADILAEDDILRAFVIVWIHD